MSKNLSRTQALAAKTLFAAFQVLKESGGTLPGNEVFERVGRRVELDEWALARYDKSGYIRWQSTLHFYSIDAMKAGFLLKKKGVWYLTSDGEEALSLGEVGLLRAAQEAYAKWNAEREKDQVSSDEELTGTFSDKGAAMTLDRIEQIALEELDSYVNSKNAYEFQELAAALLRAMGYYTPFIAPRGKDRGVDIIAYRDPLGSESPRIKVQVKHRDQPASVQQIRELMGLLQKDGDVGIFISTGGFTPDARTTALQSHAHIEMIDLQRFISLWREFYPKLTDEDKTLLPMVPIYFLKPTD
jgi:restriction system protein